jgi:proline iminopeptidase
MAAAPVQAQGEHQFIVNGVRLWYRIAGPSNAGPPVIYLHGGPGYNSHSFSVIAGPRLERKLTMVYLDQRGSGRSERPWDKAYSIELLVQDVEGLRKQIGAPRVALIGHSFGGTIALEYAARYPDRVSKVVFVDGLSDGPASMANWRLRLRQERPGEVARIVTHAPADSCEEAKQTQLLVGKILGSDSKGFFDRLQFIDQELRKKQDKIDEQSGLENTGELSNALFSSGLACYRFTAYSKLTMPVLIIGGRKDGAIGIEPMRRLAQSLPRATLVEYENSAHFPYVEEPDRFAADVLGFLANR